MLCVWEMRLFGECKYLICDLGVESRNRVVAVWSVVWVCTRLFELNLRSSLFEVVRMQVFLQFLDLCVVTL